MICDQLENIEKYSVLEPFNEQVTQFIKSLDLQQFDSGKKMIQGDNLYAILTAYETKSWEQTAVETHDDYYDVVIVLEGEEYIYADFRNRYEITDAYNKERDITFYELKKEAIRIHLTPGMFVFFGPNDVHHPYVDSSGSHHIKKVTFKIKIDIMKK